MRRLVHRISVTSLRWVSPRDRRLEMTEAGYWYVAFTIFLGVAAIGSSNNVLYLLESFLLGGLILSGILSEQSIQQVRAIWVRNSARAGVLVHELVGVENPGRLPLYGISLGEWQRDPVSKNEKFVTLVYVPVLGPKAKVEVPFTRTFSKRGKFVWQGWFVQTQAPFGFATKRRLIEEPGARIVWPQPLGELEWKQLPGGESRIQAGIPERAEGEVRALSSDEPWDDLIWSATWTRGQAVARVRRVQGQESEVLIDTRQGLGGEEGEKKIRIAATQLYRSSESTPLRVLGKGNFETKKVGPRRAALDWLALWGSP